MVFGGLSMKLDFAKMPRSELIAYVRSHRDDDAAFQVLLQRRSPDAEATWYHCPSTEEGMGQMAEVFRLKFEGQG
jgi:hypothetical protein